MTPRIQCLILSDNPCCASSCFSPPLNIFKRERADVHTFNTEYVKLFIKMQTGFAKNLH